MPAIQAVDKACISLYKYAIVKMPYTGNKVFSGRRMAEYNIVK